MPLGQPGRRDDAPSPKQECATVQEAAADRLRPPPAFVRSSPAGMHITLRQAAAYLDVPEATVRRWIANRGLPAHTINERLHCNAIELWQWAVEHGIPVSQQLFEQ